VPFSFHQTRVIAIGWYDVVATSKVFVKNFVERLPLKNRTGTCEKENGGKDDTSATSSLAFGEKKGRKLA
jgi:hypothetical protein